MIRKWIDQPLIGIEIPFLMLCAPSNKGGAKSTELSTVIEFEPSLEYSFRLKTSYVIKMM